VSVVCIVGLSVEVWHVKQPFDLRSASEEDCSRRTSGCCAVSDCARDEPGMAIAATDAPVASLSTAFRHATLTREVVVFKTETECW
jgi:hypothetical protein